MYGAELLRVRNEFATRWRDRKRASDRKLAEIREAEGVTVRMWRNVTNKPWPENPDAEDLALITLVWEDEEVRREAVARQIGG